VNHGRSQSIRAVFAVGIFSATCGVQLGRGQELGACSVLDDAAKSRIIRAVARSAHTEPLLPTIDDQRLVPGTCYRQLSLSVASSNRRLTLFLSPDGKFVFSSLLDVSVDPWTADARRSEELTHLAASDGVPVRGPEKAPVEVVVFSDFQCPYCATFNEITERYRKANPDRIRVVHRNLPSPVHAWSGPAARAGVCIQQQNPPAFWKFHDLMFSRQKEITTESLPSLISNFLASTSEARRESYDRCMESSVPQQRLDQDLAEARSLNLDTTPAIFINGRRYTSFRDDAAFALAINLATPSVAAEEASPSPPKN
jgi:hypothetical protein